MTKDEFIDSIREKNIIGTPSPEQMAHLDEYMERARQLERENPHLFQSVLSDKETSFTWMVYSDMKEEDANQQGKEV